MTAGIRVTGTLRQRPLPLVPADALRIAPGVDLLEDDTHGGVVLLEGMATWCWAPGDQTAKRLAMVGLVEAGAARPSEVATGFGCSRATLARHRDACANHGAAALTPKPKGPQRASKLTPERVARVRQARDAGAGLEAIAQAEGIARSSVIRALARTTGKGRHDAGEPAEDEPAEDGLTPLARPVARTEERRAARAGLIAGAPPVITQGAGLPLAGVLAVLPALAATGLLQAAEETYGQAEAAFYGLHALLLTMVFAALAGQPRAEGLRRIDPADLGRLIGADRAPEPKTLRRRMAQLAALGRSDQLGTALARHHVSVHGEPVGIFYIDGHVRAYHGKHDVPKHHLARMRLSMPAEEDIWVGDERGDGLLCWQAPAGSSLVSELRVVIAKVRALVGPHRRPTVCFDRGGWSPKLFAELGAAGFDFLTYRKGGKTPEPDDAFAEHTLVDDRGVTHTYWLADRQVSLTYQDDGRERALTCRQITRRSANGHQTQILTSRTDDAAVIAHAMFSRWRQENFFRYQRMRFDLDGLDAYTTVPDDPNRTVPNPAKKRLARQAKALAAAIEQARACHARHTRNGVHAHARDAHRALGDEIDDATARLEALQADAKATPARVPLGQLHPNPRRLDPERKRIHDAVRLAAYNAESALARLLAPHWPPARNEARTLLREIFTAPADLQIVASQLHVRINPLSAPRRTRALEGLCTDLTATQTLYPGTNLTLVYTVKHH